MIFYHQTLITELVTEGPDIIGRGCDQNAGGFVNMSDIQDGGIWGGLCFEFPLEFGDKGWCMLQLEDAISCSDPHHVSDRTDGQNLISTVASIHLHRNGREMKLHKIMTFIHTLTNNSENMETTEKAWSR